MKKRSFVIHPFLFALYPILFFYSHNIKELTRDVIFMPLAISLGVVIVLYLLLFLLIKNKYKRGLSLSLFIIAFFSYGHLSQFITGPKGKLYFLISYVIIFTALITIAIRTKNELSKLSSILNAVSLFLVVYSLFSIMNYEITQRRRFKIPEDSYFNQELKPKGKQIEAQDSPDIYYLIFDRFGSSEILKEFYDFDNTTFEKNLQNKGFYVASKSKTNYPYSYLSLASSLNIEYLDYLYDQVGVTRDRTVAHRLLKYPKVIRFLKARGYKYYHLGTWWEPTRINRHADRNFLSEDAESDNFNMKEFTRKLIRTTLLQSIMNKILRDKSIGGSQRILFQLKKLGEIPLLEGPKFVFAHILLTHPPYHFDRYGNISSNKETETIPEKDRYLETIMFADRQIEILVDKIISKSERPPIIVIQADEGPYARAIKERGKDQSKRRRIRSGILNMFYLPGVDYSILYPTITPVNTFRLVFNHYFGTHFERLEDRTYVSTNNKNIYEFIDITNRIYTGTLIIRSKPKDANIYINSISIGERTNQTLRDLKPGSYNIKLIKKGYEIFETTIQLREADSITVDADLHKKRT